MDAGADLVALFHQLASWSCTIRSFDLPSCPTTAVRGRLSEQLLREVASQVPATGVAAAWSGSECGCEIDPWR